MNKKNNITFRKITIISTISMILLGGYVGYILFYSKNSYKIYTQLKQQKAILKSNIAFLKEENARIYENFCEFKNMEPEWTE